MIQIARSSVKYSAQDQSEARASAVRPSQEEGVGILNNAFIQQRLKNLNANS